MSSLSACSEKKPFATLEIANNQGHPIRCCAYGHDKTQLFEGSDGGHIRRWNLGAQRECIRVEGHSSHVYEIAVHPVSKVFASSSRDKTIKIWDHSLNLLRTLEGHTETVRGIDFSRTPTLVSGSVGLSGPKSLDAGEVRLWDVNAGYCINRLLGCKGTVFFSVVFSPDGNQVAGGGPDIHLWDVRTAPNFQAFLQGHSIGVCSVVYFGSYLLISGGADTTVKIWDLRTQKCLTTLKEHTSIVNRVSVAHSTSWLASASQDKSTKLWNLKDMSCQTTLVAPLTPSEVHCVSWAPQNGYSSDFNLASSYSDGVVRLWDVTPWPAAPTLLAAVSSSSPAQREADHVLRARHIQHSLREAVIASKARKALEAIEAEKKKNPYGLAAESAPTPLAAVSSSSPAQREADNELARQDEIQRRRYSTAVLRLQEAAIARKALEAIEAEKKKNPYGLAAESARTPLAAVSSSSSSAAGAAALESTGITVIFPSEVIKGDKLGEGTFGAVFQATWKGKTVAYKVMHQASVDPSGAEKFLKEASIMLSLSHRNIVRLYAICISSEYGLVMEFMRKGSLASLLRKEDPEWKTRMSIATQMAAGLSFLHDRRPPVVHRDLKSLNVLVDSDYTTKLADFGLSTPNSGTSYLKNVKGTLAWTAPEVLNEESPSRHSDIYSLGVTFWEIASREYPFSELSLTPMIIHIVRGGRPKIPDKTPPAFSTLIQACWRQEPTSRPLASEVLSSCQEIQKTI